MNIKNLLMFLALTLGANASARVDDAPDNYGPKEKLEWISSSCKWRITHSSELSGYTPGNISRKDCLAIGRFTAMSLSNESGLTPTQKFWLRTDFAIIYDDHKGNKEVCRLTPQKDPYDSLTNKEFTEAYIGHEGQYDALIKKLDSNIKLDCVRL